MTPCPYTVGTRTCVAGPAGHPGRHDWPMRPADRYVRGIRNADKHAYAIAYLAWQRGMASEPVRPNGLSVMAAQAVRMRLADI